MAIKIFSIKNKATGKIERLIKAESKGQVNKHLAACVDIDTIGSVEIVDLMSQGALIAVEDATSQASDGNDESAAAPAIAVTPAAAASPGEPLGADGVHTGEGTAAANAQVLELPQEHQLNQIPAIDDGVILEGHTGLQVAAE